MTDKIVDWFEKEHNKLDAKYRKNLKIDLFFNLGNIAIIGAACLGFAHAKHTEFFHSPVFYAMDALEMYAFYRLINTLHNWSIDSQKILDQGIRKN